MNLVMFGKLHKTVWSPLRASRVTLALNFGAMIPFAYFAHTMSLLRAIVKQFIHLYTCPVLPGQLYAASKFGLVELSEVVYRELAAEGIKVTTLCPGWVNTEMATRGGCPHPADRIIQPSDIWRNVQWLLRLGSSVSIMEVLLECSVDVERRSTMENK
jgi:NAD(P)-dependent dehydrogenase (short-subunit alcohol dehydrogenase family)